MHTKVALLTALCTTLLLLQLTHAKDFEISGEFSQTYKTYDGDILKLDGLGNVQGFVTVSITDGVVSGNGLKVSGFSQIPSSFNAVLQMKMRNTRVQNSEILFTKTMPPNSYIHIVSTSGTMTSRKALFTFDGLILSKSAYLLLEETTVTWSVDNHAPGSVVAFAGTSISSINENSGLFVFNTKASHASSILSLNKINTLTISKGSVLGIDWGSCDNCSVAAAVVHQLSVADSSMFRISHIEAKGKAHLLLSEGIINVNTDSLYLVKDCTLDSTRALFSFVSFNVFRNSLASFVDLKTSSPLFGKKGISECNLDPSSQMYGRVKGEHGTFLTANDFKEHGLPVKLITQNGKVDGNVCAYSSCLPNHFDSNSDNSCKCKCDDKYMPPACTTMLDPVHDYNPSGKPLCSVSNCWLCHPSDANKCNVCDRLYESGKDGECIPVKPPPPRVIVTPPPTSPPVLYPSNRSRFSEVPPLARINSCPLENCQKCALNNKSCRKCKPGYKRNVGICIKVKQGASLAPGPLLIGVASALAVAALL